MILMPCLASETFCAPARSPISQSRAVAPSPAYSAFQPDWGNTLSFPASSSVITWPLAGCLPAPYPFTSLLAKLSLSVVQLKCHLLQESLALLWGPVLGLLLQGSCFTVSHSPRSIPLISLPLTMYVPLACIPGPRLVGKSDVCRILYNHFPT